MTDIFVGVASVVTVIVGIGFWLHHKDKLIREAEFDQHWEEAQSLIYGEE